MPSGSLARPCPGHRVCSHWLRRPVTCSAKSLPDLGTSYPCPRAAWMKSAGAEIWGATEVPDPSLEAGVLPAAPPKARLWDQKPAKCRNRVGNAAGCYARAEASQGKHRTFVMPVSWTGGPQKVCLFNKKYKKREKKEKNPKKTNHKTKPKNHQESASRSCHPVAGPRVFCAGEAQPQQGPGVPRSPAGAQEPPPAPPGRLLSLTEPWFLATGQASSQSPARGAAERGAAGTWQLLAGFAAPTAGPPRAVPACLPSPACAQGCPRYPCVCQHTSLTSGLFVPSGTSPASLWLFQAQI